MKGLILSGRADFSLDREVSEEGFNFWSTHFVGMTFVVEENKPPDPLNISFFGAVGVMLETNTRISHKRVKSGVKKLRECDYHKASSGLDQ
jgi:hypothetical protein